MSSKKGKRLTVRFDDDFYDEIEAYRKLHKLKTWKKALHSRDRGNLQIINEQQARIIQLEQEQKSVFSYLNEKGLSQDAPLEDNISRVKEISRHNSMEFSEKACEFMVYVKKDPKCGDPDSPLSSYLKRHLNPQICALCQKLKMKKLEEAKKKEKDKIKKQISFYQNRVNDRIQQKTHRRTDPFTNADGARINP